MEENVFTYKPYIDYSLIAAENSKQVIPYLSDFKNDLIHPLEPHYMNAESIRKYLNSQDVTQEIRGEFREFEKNITDALSNILRAFSELETEMQERQLEVMVQKDYYPTFLSSDMNEDKLQFLQLLKTYENIKGFNIKVKSLWIELSGYFERIKINTLTNKFLEKVLTYQVYPRIELTELTELMLKRLNYILKIEEETIDIDKVSAKGSYSSLLSYTPSILFREDLDQVVADIHKVKTESSQIKQKELIVEDKNSCLKSPYLLDSRGQELFNQSYLYTLEIDARKIDNEIKKIENSWYIETHLGAEETVLRRDLIRSHISNKKEKTNNEKKYSSFLIDQFNNLKEDFSRQFFDFSDEEIKLFFYHLGPLSFLRILIKNMQELRTGCIHRRMKKNQMLRELPLEFIKFRLKDWWDEDIYKVTNQSNRNSYELYQSIIRQVKKMWFEDQPEILSNIKKNPQLLRALKIHDLKILKVFIDQELPNFFNIMFQRFLGHDFLYLTPIR